MNPKYGIDLKSISGIILNDAAGLDMKHYLEENPPTAAQYTNLDHPPSGRMLHPFISDKNTPPFFNLCR
jgi:hypothetical protein